MKRLGYLVMLMALSSSAQAGNTFSFVVGGHRVNIDAPRNCRFASCVSLSFPGIYQAHRKRDRDDDTGVAPAPAPAKQPAPVVAPTQVAPVVTSVKPAATPVCAPPAPQPRSPLSPTLAATTTQPAPAPPPRPEPDKTASSDTPPDEKAPVVDLPIEKPLVEKPPVETPPLAAKPVTDAAPVVTKVSQRIESDPDSPLGDWQTEGKTGTVRIEQCGKALCGYVLNLASNVQEDIRENVQENVQENVRASVKGDAVLINMKPKSDTVWSGNIYSRASGNTYYAMMTMKGTNTLRVEACALGRFFCSGNDWTRIATPPQKLIISRQVTTEPRS
jgi:uncharacterized protein (DUF2147 family)